jgi:hypothetical protein
LRELEAKVLEHHPEIAAPARPRSEPGAGTASEAPATAPRAPPSRARRRPRAGVLIAAAALVLGAAAIAAALRSGEKPAVPARASLDLAANSIAGMAVSGRAPEFGIPLPGRPTDVAAADGTAYVSTVESPALTVIDARSRSRSRTVPLRMTPGAVAIAEDGVWVADSRRGLVVRLAPGYQEQTARISYPRAPTARPNVGGFRLDPTSLAAGAGASAAWTPGPPA